MQKQVNRKGQVIKLKANKSAIIRDRIVFNLLDMHDKLSKTGNIKDIIKLSKFILKISNKFDNELLELSFEQNDSCPQKPPNKR